MTTNALISEQIQENLKKLRALRFICHFPWLMIFMLALAMLVLPTTLNEAIMPIYKLFFVWAFVGLFLSLFIRPYACPRCSEKFHYKKHGSWYSYNDFARKCMNCGLKLKGKD